MKKHSPLLLLGVLLVLMGCTREHAADTLPHPQLPNGNQASITLDEAKAEVENLLACIDRDGTRSDATVRTITDFYCVGANAVTRSTVDDDTEAPVSYVFNFADNEGFAIVAGDRRIESPVLLLTDEGYLDPAQEVEHPWLATYLLLADNYCQQAIEQAEQESNGDTRISINYTQWEWVGDWYEKERLGQRTYLNWNQRSPFNDNIPRINGSAPPLGCTATATMLLMAWYQYPQRYAGHRYDWTEMRKHCNTQTNGGRTNPAAYADLAKLGEIITRKENLDMSFSLSGSGAWLYNIPRTLKNLGYFHGGTHAEWNQNLVLNELREYPHYPVAVSAYAKSTTTSSGVTVPKYIGIPVKAPEGYSEGHSFLLESALLRERKIRYVYTGTMDVATQTLVYVNYGWSGSSNGYYNAGVFNTNAGPVTRSGSSGYYQYWINMVYGVRI